MIARGALVALLLLTACREAPHASAPDPPAAPTAPDAPAPARAAATTGCLLLNPAEVSEAAGAEMRVVSPPGSTGCSLASTPPGLAVEWMVLPRSSVFDQVAAHEAAEPVDASGAAAFFVQVEGDRLAQLHVASHEWMVVMTLRSESGADLRATAGRLAPLAAARL